MFFFFFSSSSSPIAACLSSWWVFFLGRGVVTAPVYRAYEKVLAPTVQAWVKCQRARGRGQEALKRNLLLFTKWHIHSRSPPCVWVTCVLFLCGAVHVFRGSWACKPPPSLQPLVSFSLPSTAALCFLLGKCTLVVPGVLVVPGGCPPASLLPRRSRGLNWCVASSLRVALDLRGNLHGSLIGDKCTWFFYLWGSASVHRDAF